MLKRNRGLHIAGWLAALLGLVLFSAALAYPPDQADQGATVFAERCSTCHGDVGQGLTDEFRMTWAVGDRNCWVPGCHGARPPKPGGFTLPRDVPALVGPGTLARFANAQALHDFISTAMPMQEPGVLPEEQYWAVTAFLLRANGVPADGQELDATTASSVAVPRSGQPAPIPVRTPGTVVPLSAREMARVPRRMPPPASTPQVVAVPQGAAPARPAHGQANSAAAPAGGRAAIWTAALVVVLLGAGVVAGRGHLEHPGPLGRAGE